MTYSIKVIVLLMLFVFCEARLSATQQLSQPRSKIEFRLAETYPAERLMEVTIKGKPDKIYLREEIVITGADILEASVVANQGSNFFEINVHFTQEGARKMEEATKDHIGKLLAIVVEGQVVVAAMVTSIIKGESQINGQFTKEEAERIADAINSK